MATITSLGVGSGLDLTGLLDQLQDAERGKLAPITLQKKQQEAKISAYGQLQTSLDAFQDAVAKINDPKLYQSLSANVRGEGITATTTASALPGSYRVEVQNLATTGTLASTGVATRDTALALNGADSLKLTLGDDKEISISIAPDSSLDAIRDAINADKNAGVNATIVYDGSEEGYRLALSSKTTGVEASISGFAFVDSQNPGATIVGPFAEDAATKRAGEDASLTVNGITISSAKNQIEGAIQGVTLNLAELSIAEGETASSTVNVERDTLKQREAINGFVKAVSYTHLTLPTIYSV